MSVHFSNLYGIFKNSSYHVSKEKTSAQRQKRKKPLLGRPIFTLNLYSLVAVLRNQGRCFLSFPAVKGMAAHGKTPPCCFTIIII